MSRETIARVFGNATSMAGTLNAARQAVEGDDPISALNRLLKQLTGVNVDAASRFKTEKLPVSFYAAKVAQYAAQAVYSADEHTDMDSVVDNAFAHAAQFIRNPSNAWMFASAEEPTETKRGVSKQASSAELKADDVRSIIAGLKSKSDMSIALYKKYVVEAEDPLNQHQFADLLVGYVGMTPKGAVTYAYNARKHFAK